MSEDTEKPAQASGPSDPSLVGVQAIFARQRGKAAQPATDEQLALIWPPWNALPADMLPQERRWILTGDYVNRNPQHSETLECLRRDYSYLPLDKHEYCKTLARAAEWATLVKFSETTFELYLEKVKQEISYPQFDDVITERVAIYRGANELSLRDAAHRRANGLGGKPDES